MGNITPPPRAETLGIRGDNMKSAKTRQYDNPRVLRPILEIIRYAILEPSPVLMKPFETKKVMTTSQTMLSENPLKLSLRVKVFDNTHPNILIKAIAPIGNGFKMIPVIVARKMNNKCQASICTPSGIGITHPKVEIRAIADNERYFEKFIERIGLIYLLNIFA
jgi:hypothetical protein